MVRINPARRATFFDAFRAARRVILNQPGCHSCELLPATDDPGRFALVLAWEQAEDYHDRFRRSAAYREWALLLHPFFLVVPEPAFFTPFSS